MILGRMREDYEGVYECGLWLEMGGGGYGGVIGDGLEGV